MIKLFENILHFASNSKPHSLAVTLRISEGELIKLGMLVITVVDDEKHSHARKRISGQISQIWIF